MISVTKFSIAIVSFGILVGGGWATLRAIGESDGDDPRKLDLTHVPNVVRVHPDVLSGGQPDGADGFGELAELGIKTVISVDGAKPDADAARRYGLRYVHLPHGYDGIPENRLRELAKAVTELQSPIYIHCHHGKHRSPAAAGAACVAAGLISTAQANATLRLAGTGENYRGLFQSVENARPLARATLDAVSIQFRESVDVPPLAEAMVTMEKTLNRLDVISKNDWRPPVSHPDWIPAHEALMLREQYTEALRTPEVQADTESFRSLMREAEALSQALHDALAAWSPSSRNESPPKAFSAIAKKIRANCKTCHAAHRD